MTRLQAIRRMLTDLRHSAARFEHRGVVVAYRGVVVDQTAIVAAIDAAVDAVKGDPSAWCASVRVVVSRSDVDADGATMMASWSGGMVDRGTCRVTAGDGCAEAIRRGVHALLSSRVDPDWRPEPLGDRVF